MSASIVQAKYDQLEQIAGRFGRAGETCAALEHEVRGAYDPLADGGWLGRGAASFTGEMEGVLFPALQRLAAALEAAREVTLELRARLLEAEREAAAPFQGQGEGDAPPATIVVKDSPTTPSRNPFASFSPLDWFQFALDLFGFIPVIGEPADLINAFISAARGDWAGAGLSLAALWPAGGQAATIAKIGAKYGDEVAAVVRNLDTVIRGSDEAAAAVDTLRSGGRIDDLLRQGNTLSEQDWRRLIDGADNPQLADDMRYQRYLQDKHLDDTPADEILDRDSWQVRKNQLEANRLRGRADEDATLNELGIDNNNYRGLGADGEAISPVQRAVTVDGRPMTVRPDGITDGRWIDVKSVDVSGATPDKPQVVYNTLQQQAQREAAELDGNKGLAVVISSSDSALVRPSRPLSASGEVFHRNPETGQWLRWDRDERSWDTETLTSEQVRSLLNSKP